MIHLDLKLPHVRRVRWLPRMAAAQQLNCRSTFWGLAFRAATNANTEWNGHFRCVERVNKTLEEKKTQRRYDLWHGATDPHTVNTRNAVKQMQFSCVTYSNANIFPNRISRALRLKRCQMNSSGDGSCILMFNSVKWFISWSDIAVSSLVPSQEIYSIVYQLATASQRRRRHSGHRCSTNSSI